MLLQLSVGYAGKSKDNSKGDSAHPKRKMRRYWTVGPKPTKRSERSDFSFVQDGG